jgi:hypothetical protein
MSASSRNPVSLMTCEHIASDFCSAVMLLVCEQKIWLFHRELRLKSKKSYYRDFMFIPMAKQRQDTARTAHATKEAGKKTVLHPHACQALEYSCFMYILRLKHRKKKCLSVETMLSRSSLSSTVCDEEPPDAYRIGCR